MKIRTGFVSNSSSSSFIITGIDVSPLEFDVDNIVDFYERLRPGSGVQHIEDIKKGVDEKDVDWFPELDDLRFFYAYDDEIYFGSVVCPFGITPEEAVSGFVPPNEAKMLQKVAEVTGKELECRFYTIVE